MKAAYGKVPFQFELRDVPVRMPDVNEVLVRVRACGVCGTDLHIVRKSAAKWRHLGHELTGKVEKVGAGVKNVRPGDNVVVENCTFCGVCENCKNNHIELCSNYRTMGDQSGMAEYITTGSHAVYPLEGLNPVHSAIIEPLGVALDVTGVADIPLNSTVCVMGPGPIGLMVVRIAKLYGAKKVILVGNSHSKARLDVGEKLGADEIVHADKVDVGEYFKKRYPKGVERVIVTSPPKTILDAIKITSFGGVIAFIGIDFGGEEMVTLDINQVHFKRLQLRASHAIPNTFFPIAIDLLKRKVIDPELIISHTFPLERFGEAMTFAEKNKSEVVKVVIEC